MGLVSTRGMWQHSGDITRANAGVREDLAYEFDPPALALSDIVHSFNQATRDWDAAVTERNTGKMRNWVYSQWTEVDELLRVMDRWGITPLARAVYGN